MPRSQNIGDFEVCLKALYNFKGSRIPVGSSIFDRYINKAIEISCPEKCLDVSSSLTPDSRLPPVFELLSAHRNSSELVRSHQKSR